MKKNLPSFLLITSVVFLSLFFENPKAFCKAPAGSELKFKVTVSNPINVVRKEAVVSCSLKKIKDKYPLFNVNDFYVTAGSKEIPSQAMDKNGDGTVDEVLFLSSFKPNEKKEFVFHYSENGKVERHYKQMAQAVLGIKTDYNKVNGYYTGGKFVNIDSAVVPKDHFAHDALYRIEGPGWESDLIAYRYYLDSRNRNDITGKRTHDMILQKMGANDLVSNSAESYTKMLDWGMDIFKVGESLGIGSIAMWYDGKVNTLSSLDEEKCKITADGPIQADILTKYLGWKVGEEKFNLTSNLSINAGSRLTKMNLNLKGKDAALCTGLAKHKDCTLIKSYDGNSDWKYIGLYGKQSLSGDNLGIALFYKAGNLNKVTEDSLSYIVVLNPAAGRLVYYFAAAWEQEPGGIKNISEFKNYLEQTADELSHPFKVSF